MSNFNSFVHGNINAPVILFKNNLKVSSRRCTDKVSRQCEDNLKTIKYPLSPIFLTGKTRAHRFSAPFWVEQTFSKIFTTTDHPVLAHLLLSTLTSYLLPQNWIWKNVSHEHFISLVVSTRLFFHFSLSLSTVTFSDCGAWSWLSFFQNQFCANR